MAADAMRNREEQAGTGLNLTDPARRRRVRSPGAPP